MNPDSQHYIKRETPGQNAYQFNSTSSQAAASAAAAAAAAAVAALGQQQQPNSVATTTSTATINFPSSSIIYDPNVFSRTQYGGTVAGSAAPSSAQGGYLSNHTPAGLYALFNNLSSTAQLYPPRFVHDDKSTATRASVNTGHAQSGYNANESNEISHALLQGNQPISSSSSSSSPSPWMSSAKQQLPGQQASTPQPHQLAPESRSTFYNQKVAPSIKQEPPSPTNATLVNTPNIRQNYDTSDQQRAMATYPLGPQAAPNAAANVAAFWAPSRLFQGDSSLNSQEPRQSIPFPVQEQQPAADRTFLRFSRLLPEQQQGQQQVIPFQQQLWQQQQQQQQQQQLLLAQQLHQQQLNGLNTNALGNHSFEQTAIAGNLTATTQNPSLQQQQALGQLAQQIPPDYQHLFFQTVNQSTQGAFSNAQQGAFLASMPGTNPIGNIFVKEMLTGAPLRATQGITGDNNQDVASLAAATSAPTTSSGSLVQSNFGRKRRRVDSSRLPFRNYSNTLGPLQGISQPLLQMHPQNQQPPLSQQKIWSLLIAHGIDYAALTSVLGSSDDIEGIQYLSVEKLENLKALKPIERTREGFVCSMCDKSFGYKQHLQTHIKTVHLGIKRHKCPHCFKPFGEKSALTKHVKTVHAKSRPYKCDICGSSFGQKAHLKKHSQSKFGCNSRQHASFDGGSSPQDFDDRASGDENNDFDDARDVKSVSNQQGERDQKQHGSTYQFVGTTDL
mmetsp:Transcript_13342/g.25724  ORF Transcript_13342/g.25724 Transcript_13342/m.25724 type:complete len:729 (-) Transcript_13342:547-2733(-)